MIKELIQVNYASLIIMISLFVFILTNDYDTANKLIETGLKIIGKSGDVYMFVNDSNKILKFDDDNLKFSFTNKLMF